MPWMCEDEIDALAKDIGEHEQRLAIFRLPDGRLLDGRNRELACRVAGFEPWYQEVDVPESAIPLLVASLNLNRRHLTREDKRALVEAILRADPQLSDRRVAVAAGVDHKTVGVARRGLVTGGEFPQLPKRTSKDGASHPVCGSGSGDENRGAGELPLDRTPQVLVDLRRAAEHLDSSIRRIGSESTPAGRTLVVELRNHGIELKIDDTPDAVMGTKRVECGRRVTHVPLVESIREAIEETITRVNNGKAVQK